MEDYVDKIAHVKPSDSEIGQDEYYDEEYDEEVETKWPL